ncbi:hypothetical protein P7K49_002499 [Saguinus oedipus]|uniref:Uncharacterized protein n=1 Tax=Saguinus oedipus TaxID=9490 RepID=A0ABQ9WHH9_SAGOE|nr:hypothetical protein P7K49_002499 [Saguinus oedipus]
MCGMWKSSSAAVATLLGLLPMAWAPCLFPQILAAALTECHRKSSAQGKPLALKVFVAGRNRLENDGATALAEAFRVSQQQPPVKLQATLTRECHLPGPELCQVDSTEICLVSPCTPGCRGAPALLKSWWGLVAILGSLTCYPLCTGNGGDAVVVLSLHKVGRVGGPQEKKVTWSCVIPRRAMSACLPEPGSLPCRGPQSENKKSTCWI